MGCGPHTPAERSPRVVMPAIWSINTVPVTLSPRGPQIAHEQRELFSFAEINLSRKAREYCQDLVPRVRHCRRGDCKQGVFEQMLEH